jgi:arginyl-tRNA synthetase
VVRGGQGAAEIRAAALHDIEHGGNDTADMAAFIADRIVRCHLKTMARMNIGYDLLTWEGDILRLQFWAHAFEVLKKTGAVYLQTEGKLKGCWVMKIDDDRAAPAEGDARRGRRRRDDEDDAEQREKVIVRSNGTVTYVGKDMAYQFWKFGLLGRTSTTGVSSQPALGGPLWATSSDPPSGAAGASGFRPRLVGVQRHRHAPVVPAEAAEAGARRARPPEQAERLDPLLVRDGGAVARHRARARLRHAAPTRGPAVRRGVGPQGARRQGRRPARPAGREGGKRGGQAQPRSPTRRVGAPSPRRSPRGRPLLHGQVLARQGHRFDIDEALSFEGESGPYLQYAAVRANNIFQKLQERHGIDEAAVLAALAARRTCSSTRTEAHDLWGLVLEAARLDDVVEQAVRTLELSVLAKYAFGLAQAFNAFYHKYPILNEEREDVRLWRAAAVAYYRAS